MGIGDDKRCMRAVWALGQIGSATKVAANDVVQVVAEDVEPTVRMAAAKVLVKVAGDGRRAVEGLGKAFTAANPAMQENLTGVLADLGARGEPILAALVEIQKNAATANLRQALARATARIRTDGQKQPQRPAS